MSAQLTLWAEAPAARDADLLDFPPDAAMRRQLQPAVARQHPGKLHLEFAAWLATRYIRPGTTVLDPMAGSGSALFLTLPPWGCHVVCNELEGPWVAAMAATWQYLGAGWIRPTGTATLCRGDARALRGAFLPPMDALFCSPPYGAALSHQRHGADYHPDRHAGGSATALRRGYDAPMDGSRPDRGQRNAAQIGNLRGARYAAAMGEVYAACVPLVTPGGPIILVIKNPVEHNAEVDLIGQARGQLEALGCTYQRTHWRRVPPAAWHNIRRAAHPDALIVQREAALVFTAPGDPGRGGR